MERAIRSALRAGLKAGEFSVIRDGDKVSVLTHAMRNDASLPANDVDWVTLAGETTDRRRA